MSSSKIIATAAATSRAKAGKGTSVYDLSGGQQGYLAVLVVVGRVVLVVVKGGGVLMVVVRWSLPPLWKGQGLT